MPGGPITPTTSLIQSNSSDILTPEEDNCVTTVTPASESICVCRQPEKWPPYSSSELVNDTTVRIELENLSIVASTIESSIEPLMRNDTVLKTDSQNLGPGWKIAFDNLDIFQRGRHTREDNQNKGHH